MFRTRIKAAKESMARAREMQLYYANRTIEDYFGYRAIVEKDRLGAFVNENLETSLWWREWELLYTDILQVLIKLQGRYRKEFGFFSFLNRNGHSKRLGLELMARARLSGLESRALQLQNKTGGVDNAFTN